MAAATIRTARFSFVCAIVLCAFALLAPNAVGQTQTAQWLNPISTPTFVNVYWDQTWDSDNPGMTMNQIDDFTSALVNSTYFSGLAEYGVTSVSFSPRSFVANPSCGNGGTAPYHVSLINAFYPVGNPGVTQFMECEIVLGGLPASANTIYNLFLPPHTLQQDTLVDLGILLPGTYSSCLHGHYTGYHFFVTGPGLRNAFTVNFTNTNCVEPPGPPDFTGLTENLSHEMAEAATDPVPLVSVVLSGGTDEIGDFCIPGSGFAGAPPSGASPPGFLNAFGGGTTEMYWSNSMQTCVSGYSSRTGPSFGIQATGSNGATILSLTDTSSGFGTLPAITTFSGNVGTSVNVIKGTATIPYLAVQDVDQSGQIRWEAGNSLKGDPIPLSMTWSPIEVDVSLPSTIPTPLPDDSLRAIVCNPASGVCSSQQLAFPTISQLSPSSGPAAGGTVVTISGQGFTGDTTNTVVSFGSLQATLQSVSPNKVMVKTPVSRPGNVNVSLVTKGLPSTGASFLYCHPQVNQVTPNSSPQYQATSVKISGSCFTGATSVSFGGAGQAFVGTPQVTSVMETDVLATAPAWPNAPGCQVNVQVMSPDLDGLVGGSASSGSLFFYGPPNRCFNPNEYGSPLSFCFQNPAACPTAFGLSSLITLGNPQPQNFGDLAGYEWAASAINEVASQGVLHGTSAQKFSPGQGVTRADFANGLVRTLSFGQAAAIVFADVETRDAAHPIYAAVQPYMTTFADRTGSISFNAALPLQRQEVALSVVSLLVASKKIELVTGKAAENILNEFEDKKLILGALRPYVATAIQNHILAAEAAKKSWRPDAFLTRAEFAVAIARIEESFKKKE